MSKCFLIVASNGFYSTFLLFDIFVVRSYINHILRRKDIHLKYFIFNWSATYPLPPWQPNAVKKWKMFFVDAPLYLQWFYYLLNLMTHWLLLNKRPSFSFYINGIVNLQLSYRIGHKLMQVLVSSLYEILLQLLNHPLLIKLDKTNKIGPRMLKNILRKVKLNINAK